MARLPARDARPSRDPKHDSRRARTLFVLALSLVGCAPDDPKLDRVERTATFTPPVVAFGVRAIGTLHQLETRLSSSGSERLSVTDVRFDPPRDAFDARRTDGSTLRGATLDGRSPVDIVVRYGPTEEGNDDTTMIVVFAATEARVPITAEAHAASPARARVSPSSVTFGAAIEVGRDVVQSITITNDGEQSGRVRATGLAAPFSLTEVGGLPLATTELDPGASRPLELHFRPTAAGTFMADAMIALGDGPASTLSVRGDAIAGGTLRCDRASVDLGDVPRGTTARSSVHCSVTGGPYTLASITFAGGGATAFSLNGAPPPGTSITELDLEVLLEARGLPTHHFASLDLTSGTGARTSLAVTGDVVAPSPTSTDLSVELRWDTTSTDLDLHLVRAGASPFSPTDDCYFEHKHPDWGVAGDERDDPFLDNDDRSGPGPETVNLGHATERYEVYVQYFDYSGGAPPPTQVTLTNWLRGASTQLARTMSACGATWYVGTLAFDGAAPTFIPAGAELDTWKDRTFKCR